MLCAAVRDNFARNVFTQMFSNAINVEKSAAYRTVTNFKKTQFGGVRVVDVPARFAQHATLILTTACQYALQDIRWVLRATWSAIGVCGSALNAANLFVIGTLGRNITFVRPVVRAKGILSHGLRCC